MASRKLTSIAYSDFGNVIYVKGTTSFWEGTAELILKNESAPELNAPKDVDYASIARKSVPGENGDHAFDTSFNTGDPGAKTVPEEGQCIGVYGIGSGKGGVDAIGAFTYCPPSLSGRPQSCKAAIFKDAESCLDAVAPTPKITAVYYSDFGNVLYVEGVASFWEGQANLFVRNETNAAANQPTEGLSSDFDKIASKTVQGANGTRKFTTEFDTGNPGTDAVPNDGDCIGVYEISSGNGRRNTIGAFTYCTPDLSGVHPKTCKQTYFPDAASCLK